ncbi:MAG: tetratricopeptide repeat protein [Verrucomicrobia bacterium]|nr:tetratricopeptide repeat protein [Verrucomicrobiota bacterium]
MMAATAFRNWVFPLLAISVFTSCREEKKENTSGPELSQQALVAELFRQPVRDPSEGYAYAGAESCRSCHEKAYDEWRQSTHFAAMGHATPETVLGDFSGVEFEHFGHKSRFFQKDGGFWVNTENGEGVREDFRVAYTFGIDPLQQYLIEFPGGRLQALQICWDTRPAGEGGQRWFHLYPGEEVPPGDALHWTRRHFNWNYMCADCHSTNLAKNYDGKAGGYRTTWSDMNVACEACHGPGSRHIEWAGKQTGQPAKDEAAMGLLVRLKEPQPGAWGMNAETGQPKRFPALTSQAQLETCAPCHSHRQPLQTRKLAGQGYLDSYVPTPLTRVHYHGDGQIHEEVYEYGSFIQSKMHHNNVRCTDCHHPHTMRPLAEGNLLCVRCHQAARYDATAHHFHGTGSAGASCVECHMPSKYYMVVDKRHDHSLRIPRPDLTLQYGTPNACNNCHKDKDSGWAAEAFVKWWGEKPRPVYGEVLAKGRRDVRVWEKELAALARAGATPAIARASVLELLEEAPTERSMALAREKLGDPDPMVRRQAVKFLGHLPMESRWEVLSGRLADPVRAVRVEAARVLAGGSRAGLGEVELRALESAEAEYLEMQEAVADVPESHLALAEFFLAKGDRGKAESNYREAMALDPLFVPARVNFAEFLYANGRLSEAEPILREAVALQPQDGYAHEAWGRFLVRAKRYQEGVAALRKAVELMPERADLHYFIGVGFHSLGSFDEALPFLRKALELDPGNREYAGGAAAICREAGREDLAREFLGRIDP